MSVSREQTAAELFLGDLLDAQAQARGTHGEAAFLRQPSHLMERSQHQLLELLIDLGLAPEKLLNVLNPFEVRDGHATGVAEHVGDNENVAVREDRVRLGRRGPVGRFCQHPASKLWRIGLS